MLEELAVQAGVADSVDFLGPLPRRRVLDEIEGANVLVAPSVPTRGGKREGIPMVLMEGMAVGRPVVSTRLSGIPELVADGRTGLLVEPGDPAALAEALRRLAADADLREHLGNAARRAVEQDFDLSRSVARLRDLMALTPRVRT